MAPPAMTNIETRADGPEDSGAALVLAHGAGQDMDSPFMETIAQAIAAAGVRIVRFNFPYMTRARRAGSNRPPDPEAVLLDTWRSVIATVPQDRTLVIGGKSLGGRMASVLADELEAGGLVCLGYPFHPPGRPDILRTAHLEHLRTPTLICQGERDTFGNEKEVSTYMLARSITLYWVPDGDHSFRPRRSSGRTEEQNLNEAAAATVDFIRHLAGC